MRDKFDVIVVGGGMAGIGAACTAAKNGADTLLIERQEMLGGLGASGGVGNFCYSYGPPIGQGEVFENVWDEMLSRGALGEDNGWPLRKNEQLQRENYQFDHNQLPLVLQEIAEANGVKLLFDSTMINCDVTNFNVNKITVFNKSLLQSFSAKIFIDATGDGLLARSAGAEVLTDGEVNQPALMVFLKTNRDSEKAPLEKENHFNEKYSVWPEPNGKIAIKLSSPNHQFDTGTAAGYNEASLYLRSQITAAVNDFKKKCDCSYILDYAAPMLGIREGKRIKGDYILTVDDVKAGRKFNDSIAFGSFTIDLVGANGVAETVPRYHIPYRSILVKGLQNLCIVGRCFSADSLAMSSARIMPTCCLMGQASGHAASLAFTKNINLRQVNPVEIREKLLKNSNNREFLQKCIDPKS